MVPSEPIAGIDSALYPAAAVTLTRTLPAPPKNVLNEPLTPPSVTA
jgi:hypothetical protein